MNALDESVSDDGQETYHLFTLDTYSVRSVSVQKGEKFFAAIKLYHQPKKLICLENFAIRYCVNDQHTCSG